MSFLERLRADPDNIDLWEVYADHLQERTDPVGELVQLSVELERGPSPATAAAIRQWLEDALPEASVVSEEAVEWCLEPLQRENLIRLELRMGHAHRVFFRVGGYWGTLTDLEPEVLAWWGTRFSQLAASPLHALARHFEVHLASADARGALGPWLIRRLPYETIEVHAPTWTRLPSLGAFLQDRPHLERLVITGLPDPSDLPLAHPDLRFLAWTPTANAEDHAAEDLLEASVTALVNADFPQLEVLSLSHLPDPLYNRLQSRFGTRVTRHEGSVP